MAISAENVVAGCDLERPIDALFVNAPLRDYGVRPRINDFTLPVLGIGYIATYASCRGFNVGVIDAEARGLSIVAVQRRINELNPRWVGLNLLAPTFHLSAAIATGVSEGIRIMVGGHQAKALPQDVLRDPRFRRLDALVIGEGELRVAELLTDLQRREKLPGVLWAGHRDGDSVASSKDPSGHWLAPDIDTLPFLDRRFLVDDPRRAEDGRIEVNMVGARGCPYDCSFCGAAISANPDITIRARNPVNITAEMHSLRASSGATAFRFVDDLFLGSEPFIRRCMVEFARARIGEWAVWDATGRINVLRKADDALLDTLVANGLREVAVGIESGSERLLRYMGKKITPEMTRAVVRRLTERGISVKGYFILGFPTETRSELDATVRHVRDLWDVASGMPGSFRASVFEFRPYPGTPEWGRLLASGRYSYEQLMAYRDIDLADQGVDEAMRGRDEFNFSVNIKFGEPDISVVRDSLVTLSREQYERRSPRAPAGGDEGGAGRAT